MEWRPNDRRRRRRAQAGKFRSPTGEVPAATPSKLRPVPIPPKSGFFEGPKGVVINGERHQGRGRLCGGEPRHESEGEPRGSRSATSRTASSSAPPASSGFCAAGPQRRRHAGPDEEPTSFGPGGHDRLEFWSLGKSGIVKGDQWIPYEGATGSNGGDRDVRWAAFLDVRAVRDHQRGRQAGDLASQAAQAARDASRSRAAARPP